MKKFTKIVCTIGPASDSKDMIKKLYNKGMNVARLNFSHGTYDYFEKIIKSIKDISEDIAILLDTKGPEIRTGDMENNKIILEDMQELTITNKKTTGTKEKISVDYPGLSTLDIGNLIFIDDGLIECEVIDIGKDSVKVKVLNGGVLGSKKTVSIRGHNVDIPFLMEKDIKDIEFGIKQGVDFIAASFVRKAEEVLELKRFLEQRNAGDIQIISKIEHSFSIKNFDEILEVSDGIMVARGDLGVEIPLEKVPQYQEEMIKKCREFGKPVIVATQMLESMKDNPRPTRAEVADVAQAIIQGTDAVMLSGETASGKYPVRAVEIMSKIANEYDKSVNTHLTENLEHYENIGRSISLFITSTAYHASHKLKTSAILVPTESGYTARNVSRFRPNCPIYSMSRDMKVIRQLQLSRGVFPFYSKEEHDNRDVMVNSLVEKVYNKGLVKEDDRIVVTAGFKLAKKGYTNMIEIYRVNEIIERIKENTTHK